MPRRKVTYPEKPWKRDPAVVKRWQQLIDQGKSDGAKLRHENPEPAKGWQLWDWRTLEDKPQE